MISSARSASIPRQTSRRFRDDTETAFSAAVNNDAGPYPLCLYDRRMRPVYIGRHTVSALSPILPGSPLI